MSTIDAWLGDAIQSLSAAAKRLIGANPSRTLRSNEQIAGAQVAAIEKRMWSSLADLAATPGGDSIARLIEQRVEQLGNNPQILADSFGQHSKALVRLRALTGLDMVRTTTPAFPPRDNDPDSVTPWELFALPELLPGFKAALHVQAERCARLATDPGLLGGLNATDPLNYQSDAQILAGQFGLGFVQALRRSILLGDEASAAAGALVIESLTREARTLAKDARSIVRSKRIPVLGGPSAAPTAQDARRMVSTALGGPAWAFDMAAAPPEAWLSKHVGKRWAHGPDDQWGAVNAPHLRAWRDFHKQESARISEHELNASYSDDAQMRSKELNEAREWSNDALAAGICLECSARATLPPGHPWAAANAGTEFSRLFARSTHDFTDIKSVNLSTRGPVAEQLNALGLESLVGFHGSPRALAERLRAAVEDRMLADQAQMRERKAAFRARADSSLTRRVAEPQTHPTYNTTRRPPCNTR